MTAGETTADVPRPWVDRLSRVVSRIRAMPLTFGTMLASVLAASLAIVALLAIVLWLSFIEEPAGFHDSVYSFANYVAVFTEPATIRVIVNTLEFSLVNLLVALSFGIPLAWLVERTDIGGKKTVYTLLTIGLLIPGFASAMGWLFLLHPRIGLINQMLRSLFGAAVTPISITNIFGMGCVLGLNLAPLAFIMTGAVFRAMDPALEEAAKIHGANIWQTTYRVTLRLAWPGILAASIYIFTIGFSAFDVPAIIGWSNRIFTFSTYLLVLLSSANRDLPHYGEVAAFSVVIIGFALLMSWWYTSLLGRSYKYTVVTGKAYRPALLPLGRLKYAAWGFIAFYVLLNEVMPIILIIWASLLPYLTTPSAEAFSHLSLQNFYVLPWSQTIHAIGNTALLMVLTATIATALSVAFSWIVLRSRIRGRRALDAVFFLPHAVPHVIFGVGALLATLYVIESFLPIYGTIWVLLLVFVIARLSYGTRVTNNALLQIHSELEEAAQICGASTWTTLRRVVLPLIAPTLTFTWLWIALLTSREVALAVILTVSGNGTVPVVIWSLWAQGSLGQASALALVMLVLLAPLIVIYWSVMRRGSVVNATGN